MNKLEKAARQALEALEPIHHGNMTPMAESAWKDAIAALREALEAQEPWTPDDMAYRPGGLSQPAAAEQKPVAWQYRLRPTWGGGKASWGPWEPCTKGQAEDYLKTPLLHDWAYEVRALYTAPQPARQPLTQEQAWENDEIMEVNADVGLVMGDLMRLVRAIERAHGITGEHHDKPHIDPTKVWKLPIGTKLYAAPQPARQPLPNHLIAAAPELLAALERAAAMLARFPQCDDAWKQARAAIAKATNQ